MSSRNGPFCSLLALLLATGASATALDADAHGLPAVHMAWGWPYDPVLWLDPFHAGLHWHSACYPFVSCAAYHRAQVLDKRRQRLRELRREAQPQAPEVGLETWGGLLANRPGSGAGPPAAESGILPQYRGHSQVRPEFGATGEFLPEFLDGRTHPRR